MLKISRLRRTVFIALLAAIAMLLMHTGTALIPAARYLKFEPSGSIILICGLLLGPAAAAECAVVKCILYFISHGGSPYGHLSDLIAMLSFACVACAFAHKFGISDAKKRILTCAIGMLTVTIVMIPANYIILYLQYGMSAEAVSATMIYVIPYNLLKAGLNSVVGLVLYLPVYKALSKMEQSPQA